jgi:hypothetical protein
MNSSYSATALLDDLDRRGIMAEVRDGDLYLKPRSLVELEILEALRSIKSDVIRRIRLREVDADRPDAEDYLLRRLLAGQAWLDEVSDVLHGQPNAGLGTTLNARFCHGLDMWLRLEGTLRLALNYNRCIRAALNNTCPDDTAARCSVCTGMTA